MLYYFLYSGISISLQSEVVQDRSLKFVLNYHTCSNWVAFVTSFELNLLYPSDYTIGKIRWFMCEWEIFYLILFLLSSEMIMKAYFIETTQSYYKNHWVEFSSSYVILLFYFGSPGLYDRWIADPQICERRALLVFIWGRGLIRRIA